MNTTEAFEIVKQIQDEKGEGLLETLQYMDRNLFQFDSTQREAFRVAMSGFRELFAPVATPV